MAEHGKELDGLFREAFFAGKEADGNKQETDEEKEERGSRRKRSTKETKETRQRDSSKGTAEEGRAERREEDKQDEEVSGLASVDSPEQIFLEIEKKAPKKKTTTKKVKDKVKEEIKLILVAVYSAAGTLIDECFHLTPQESEILADAIYRYLEEHNLLETVKEKSALLNLVIAFASVNIPKLLTYYSKVKAKGGKQVEQDGKAEDNTGNSDNTVRETEPSASDVKTHLNQYYS